MAPPTLIFRLATSGTLHHFEETSFNAFEVYASVQTPATTNASELLRFIVCQKRPALFRGRHFENMIILSFGKPT